MDAKCAAVRAECVVRNPNESKRTEDGVMTKSVCAQSRKLVQAVAVTMALAFTCARAYIVNLDTYSDEGARMWTNNTGDGSPSDAAYGATLGSGTNFETWAGAPGTGEVSWSVDWHNLSTPTRSVGTVLLLPGSRTPGSMIISKGTWNGSSMVWTSAYDNTAAPLTGVQQNFKPALVNVNIENANGLKYEVVDTGNLAYQHGTTRGMAGIYLFPGGLYSFSAIVSPDAASESSTAPYSARMTQPDLNLTIDGLPGDVQGEFNNTTSYQEAITYTFATRQYLAGVLVNINTVHDPRYCWKTWEITDLAGNVLASSQWGTAGDNSTATTGDRFQLLGFDGGARWTTGFILRGPFGLLSPPSDATHGNRMGEVWGITAAIPEPASLSVLALAGLAMLRRRRG